MDIKSSRNYWLFFLLFIFLFFVSSCSVSHRVGKEANYFLLHDSVLSSGHIGISIYEPAAGKYLYNYNATKYFVPASNTKLFTLYAGLKYLGDSLISVYYYRDGNEFMVEMNGDPTVLNGEFSQQSLFNFLKQIKEPVRICTGNFKTTPLGKGWAWDDYNDSYMTERSNIPIYGNLVHFFFKNDTLVSVPKILNQFVVHSESYLLNRKSSDTSKNINSYSREYLSSPFIIKRNVDENLFQVEPSGKSSGDFLIPIKTNGSQINNFQLLLDTLHNNFINSVPVYDCSVFERKNINRIPVCSLPVDSVFIPMMHRSDNFFAEQTLLMVSNEKLGYMNESCLIDTLLKNDFADIPQTPKWVDGSGLSRYNLFTPQSFVYILDKLKNDFGFERMKKILPTGGEGTLKNYYLKDSGCVYAKTGSIDNQLSLSGYLITKNNKLYIFSILVNNYKGGSMAARKAIELFLESIRSFL